MKKISGKQISSLVKKDTNLSVLIAMFVVVLAVFGILLGGSFYSVNNIQSMAFQMSDFGFFAIGMALSMLTGGIDLSIVASANLAGVVGAFILSGKLFPLPANDVPVIALAILAILATTTIGGLINGFLIAKFSVPPILATMGTMIFYTGIGMALTGGSSISITSQNYYKISSFNVLNIPFVFLLLVVAIILVSFLLDKTRFGKQIYLLGENPVALKFSGVNTEHVIMKLYTLIGLLVGFAAVIMTSSINSARMGYGATYQLQAILVAVLGGCDPNGGRGRVVGVVIGMALLQMLQSAFTIFGFTPYAKSLIWGLMLIIVMVLNFYLAKGKKAKHAAKSVAA